MHIHPSIPERSLRSWYERWYGKEKEAATGAREALEALDAWGGFPRIRMPARSTEASVLPLIRSSKASMPPKPQFVSTFRVWPG